MDKKTLEKLDTKHRQAKDEIYLQHLYDTHAQNSIFLNKALLAIPAVLATVLLSLMRYGMIESTCTKVLIFISFVILGLSTLIMLWSFFKSIKGLDGLIREKKGHTEVAATVDSINYLVCGMICVAFILLFIAFGLSFFQQT